MNSSQRLCQVIRSMFYYSVSVKLYLVFFISNSIILAILHSCGLATSRYSIGWLVLSREAIVIA